MLEMVVVIIIIGVVGMVGLRKVAQSNETAKAQATLQEMDLILKAIAGDPALVSDGRRSDYGYIGKNRAIPATLSALGVTEFLTDAWGAAYTWDPVNLTLATSGHGTQITLPISTSGALTPNDFLNNSIIGLVLDADGSPPQGTQVDSVRISVTYQSGAKDSTGITTSGSFQFTGAPVGNHTVTGKYKTQTQVRFVSIVPEVSSAQVTVVFSQFN